MIVVILGLLQQSARRCWKRLAGNYQLLVGIGFASVLVGCTSPDTGDLQQFIEEVRTSQKGRIDPLPQFPPFQTFEYSANFLRDPFEKWTDPENVAGSAGPGTGPRPDENRRKEELEKYPLDSLRMVGTIRRSDGQWAIVKSPDGMVHKVKVGHFLGQNYGKVVNLAEEGLKIRELIPDGLGGWLEREASLTLTESQ